MRRLLVTGGAGFIGCHFIEHWLRRDWPGATLVLDALTCAGGLHQGLADPFDWYVRHAGRG